MIVVKKIGSICEDEMTWKRVTDLMVQWDVAEHPGVMH